MNEQELLDHLKQESRNRGTTLDLSGKVLERLPPEIGQLKHLRYLDLSNNKLKSLPPEIGELTHLSELDLSNNHLVVLPPEVGQLIRLRKLDLRSNQLETLPSEIEQLTRLEELDLRNNQLEILPSEIGRLIHLSELYLSYNKLMSLPPEVGQLTNLSKLNIRSNQLIVLPPEIGYLIHLNELHLSSNLLLELPIEIGQLISLNKLHLINNRLETLPPEIGRLRLSQLTLDGNPLTALPPEIRGQEFRAILNFYGQQLEQDIDYLYEAKLLIIGEAGAGKTTLARKIQNSNYQPKQDEISTEGIEITRWYFSMDNGKAFRVNIWDFGGQEIYYATHQFFLTQRSLYILVADSRTEDTDFYYWLNAVELLSNNSPLLIVQNEKQDRHREINERQLRGEFTNLRETLNTNLATNHKLPIILDTIRYNIARLSHVGAELPKSWIKVREVLEWDHRNYISQEEYLQICEDNGFTMLQDKLQLSSYLHDIGVFLHFQNDDILNETIILKPSWGTDAVYRVLDNSDVIQRRGKFDRNDLANIWFEDKYALVRSKLLRLMMNFKLCYEIPSCPGVYVAPQLLSPDQPEYVWDETDSLLLKYEYQFMPKGIITRFIVEMHAWIYEETFAWKSGVLLAKEQAKAEIIEHYHYHKGEIHIRVTGRRKRDLLVMVMYEFDKIHTSYKNLKTNILVPCNCTFCKDSQTPEFYHLQLLYKYLDDKRDQIECRESYNKVNVRALIDDVISEESQLEFSRSSAQSTTSEAQQQPGISIHFNPQITQENRNPMSNISQNHYGKGDNVAGNKNLNQFNNSQDLAEAARDIKALLEQLSHDYPGASQAVIGATAIVEIDKNPTLKKRVINALKEAGTTALEEAIDHPAIKIVVAGAKGFSDA